MSTRSKWPIGQRIFKATGILSLVFLYEPKTLTIYTIGKASGDGDGSWDRANIKNRGKRKLSEYEINRIKWMHENGLAKPNFSTIVDTTNKSINEVVEHLISKLELNPDCPIARSGPN